MYIYKYMIYLCTMLMHKLILFSLNMFLDVKLLVICYHFYVHPVKYNTRICFSPYIDVYRIYLIVRFSHNIIKSPEFIFSSRVLFTSQRLKKTENFNCWSNAYACKIIVVITCTVSYYLFSVLLNCSCSTKLFLGLFSLTSPAQSMFFLLSRCR